jgi:hypothetical protein
MAIYLLDTSVIVVRHGNGLICCTINVIEIYTGMRRH